MNSRLPELLSNRMYRDLSDFEAGRSTTIPEGGKPLNGPHVYGIVSSEDRVGPNINFNDVGTSVINHADTHETQDINPLCLSLSSSSSPIARSLYHNLHSHHPHRHTSKMKFSIVSAIAFAAGVLGLGDPSTLSYDPVYSTGSTSTLTLACSNGANGLYTQGYETLSEIPGFPNVVASPLIAGVSSSRLIILRERPLSSCVGWNSAECGACYKLYYSGTQKSLYAVGVDVGVGQFVGSVEVLDNLTNGRAIEVGRVPISYLKVEPSFCGL